MLTILDTFSTFLRTTQNLSYQHKHTVQHQTALFFAFEEFLKISNISQNRDHFGRIFQLPTNNSKTFLININALYSITRVLFFALKRF
jgi:hypothetical protein